MSTKVPSIASADDPSLPIQVPATTSQVPTTTRSTPHSRWLLHLEASVCRFLNQIGLFVHSLPAPHPKPPSFLRRFPTTIVSRSETSTLGLAFYVPDDYAQQLQHGKRYLVVVNLHGGGFTMGTPKDEGRWAAMVLENVGAIEGAWITDWHQNSHFRQRWKTASKHSYIWPQIRKNLA